ncbi:MAG TPA: acyl-CoA dehydrogenase family protein [Methylosinus sp.]
MNAPFDRGASFVATAALHADDVDRKGRFPAEAVQALKDARLLSLMIPAELGGGGASLADVAEICTTLGQQCASTAMVFAMHQIKVSSLVSHGMKSEWHRSFMRRIADEQLLLASATTEGGVGGNLRNSVCAFEREGEIFRVAKEGALISYGAASDAILVTARRAPDAPPSDQRMAVLTRGQFKLERTGEWDALGMRGTCSEGFTLSGEAPCEQILESEFADIASHSMLATAHLLWSSVWFGIAGDALARAQAFVRKEARKRFDANSPGTLRLAEASTKLQLMRVNVTEGLKRFAQAQRDPDDLNSMGFAVAMNNIKIASSELSIEIINHALLIAGIAGYKNGTPYSVGRHMRDALSARVMISNDRILSNMSTLLLAQRIDARLGD